MLANSVAQLTGNASMLIKLRQLPASVWTRVFCWTAVIVAASTLISVGVTWLIVASFGKTLGPTAVSISIILPILIGTPMSIIHLARLSQLRLANQQLQVLASTDGLTSCLNRRAFTNLVNGELDSEGAFLVIDADHFKIINDHYGHDRGDEVLRLMASTIKANVRENDLVGRLGGEEFGVFLRGASLETARHVAERIRVAIAAARFAPDGAPHRLSVSVGGAFFDHQISFSDLFRIADQRLYGVKQTGRNRTDVAPAILPAVALHRPLLAG